MKKILSLIVAGAMLMFVSCQDAFESDDIGPSKAPESRLEEGGQNGGSTHTEGPPQG